MPMMSQPLGKSRFSSSTVSGLWRLFFASEKLREKKLMKQVAVLYSNNFIHKLNIFQELKKISGVVHFEKCLPAEPVFVSMRQ